MDADLQNLICAVMWPLLFENIEYVVYIALLHTDLEEQIRPRVVPSDAFKEVH